MQLTVLSSSLLLFLQLNEKVCGVLCSPLSLLLLLSALLFLGIVWFLKQKEEAEKPITTAAPPVKATSFGHHTSRPSKEVPPGISGSFEPICPLSFVPAGEILRRIYVERTPLSLSLSLLPLPSNSPLEAKFFLFLLGFLLHCGML